MMKLRATWYSRHLPRDAVSRLRRAAATPTHGDPLARIKAIERATFWTQLKYPHFYRQER